jgi:hypothetical protein
VYQYAMQLMKKFARAWNMCLWNLPRQICKNTSFGQRNLVKVVMNRTKLALKLVWGPKN